MQRKTYFSGGSKTYMVPLRSVCTKRVKPGLNLVKYVKLIRLLSDNDINSHFCLNTKFSK